MGWNITQSPAFIIIAALIGLAIGIWIGWLVWGRHVKGKHAAEKAETAARGDAVVTSASSTETETETETAETEAGTRADVVPGAAAEEPDAEPTAGTDAVPPLADSTSGPDSHGAEEVEAEAAGADVVAEAEAEAVARRAAETDAAESDVATKADAAAETDAATESGVTADAGAAAPAEAGAKAEAPAATTTAATATTATPDNLRRIEGIGPKIAAALIAAGYPSYAKIAAATEDELREAVAGQGIKFAPAAASWADQARHLAGADARAATSTQDDGRVE